MKVSGKLILKILFSVALLAFVFANTGIEQTLKQLSTANLWYIPVGVGIYLISQWLSAYRWKLLAQPLGFELDLREYYDYYLIGMYLSLFLPSAIGGDVGRMYYLAKSSGRKKREALLTLIAERGTGLSALLLLTAMVLLTPVAAPIPTPIRLLLLTLTGLGFLGFLLLQSLPLQRLITRFEKLALLGQAEIYWKNIPLLLRVLSLSLLTHACMILVHLLIAHALSLSIDVLYLIAVYGVVSLVSVIPISFNGIGVREGAYQLLLVQYGILPESALAFGLYWFLISTLTSLIGGMVLIKGHYQTPSPEEADLC